MLFRLTALALLAHFTGTYEANYLILQVSIIVIPNFVWYLKQGLKMYFLLIAHLNFPTRLDYVM